MDVRIKMTWITKRINGFINDYIVVTAYLNKTGETKICTNDTVPASEIVWLGKAMKETKAPWCLHLAQWRDSKLHTK